ncbi:MAG: shikimate dehydrogenase [Pseudomonadota bacterium]
MGGQYGVIGDPVAHSLSPLIHRGWMRDHGIDGDYRAFRIPAGTLQAGIAALERDGVRGLNVTLPHKIHVAALCDTRSPLAETLGAVNTLSRQGDGAWFGDNTDYQGFLDDFDRAHAGRLQACPILVLGAGGAAQAIVRGLSARGYVVKVANRTVSRAAALVQSLGLPQDAATSLESTPDVAAYSDAIVNTLSLGHGNTGTLDLGQGNGRLFYDISYGKAAEQSLARAAREGWKTADGLGMLVAQAALSFDIWHGVAPDRTAALARCRDALRLVS